MEDHEYTTLRASVESLTAELDAYVIALEKRPLEDKAFDQKMTGLLDETFNELKPMITPARQHPREESSPYGLEQQQQYLDMLRESPEAERPGQESPSSERANTLPVPEHTPENRKSFSATAF